jgi:putative endonuclease
VPPQILCPCKANGVGPVTIVVLALVLNLFFEYDDEKDKPSLERFHVTSEDEEVILMWRPWKKTKSHKEQAHLLTGEWGEKQAARMLGRKGYRILGQRVRVGPRDELDIVARHGEVLVFVEVKTRKDEAYGRPISSVNRAKQHSLSRAAIRYMKRLRTRPDFFRFDVVEIVGAEDSADPVIRHVENVFSLEGRYRVPW